MKKFVVFGFVLLLFSLLTNEVGASNRELKKIEESYHNVVEYAEFSFIEFDWSLLQYEDAYSVSGKSLYDFEQMMMSYIDIQAKVYNEDKNDYFHTNSSSSQSSGGDVDWQRNTGKNLPQEANYDACYLLINSSPGDIVYEANGGFGVTGHIAVVEGKFYSPEFNQYYVRVIEAINSGVVRSVIDCERLSTQRGTLYRVSDVTVSEKEDLIGFLISQLGKNYQLDFAKDCNTFESDWYCSELAWCAYLREGIDIEKNIYGFRGEPGVTPRDIRDDDNLSSIVMWPLPSNC